MGHAPVPEITDAIAAVEETDPTDLNDPIQDYIPSDAIAQLAAHETATWTLTFTYRDHQITITSTGVIAVDGRHEETWGTQAPSR